MGLEAATTKQEENKQNKQTKTKKKKKRNKQVNKTNKNLGHGGGGSSSSVLHFHDSTSLKSNFWSIIVADYYHDSWISITSLTSKFYSLIVMVFIQVLDSILSSFVIKKSSLTWSGSKALDQSSREAPEKKDVHCGICMF